MENSCMRTAGFSRLRVGLCFVCAAFLLSCTHTKPVEQKAIPVEQEQNKLSKSETDAGGIGESEFNVEVEVPRKSGVSLKFSPKLSELEKKNLTNFDRIVRNCRKRIGKGSGKITLTFIQDSDGHAKVLKNVSESGDLSSLGICVRKVVDFSLRK